jgi:hypothetical protein
MQSLFGPIEDVKLPDEKPPRDYRKTVKYAVIIVAVAALGTGGWFGYQAMFPGKLVERPVPQTMDKLLTELQGARDQIDSETRDIYGRIQQFNERAEQFGRKTVSFSQVFLQGLSAEEEQALDDLVRQEKDPSYRGILGQVVEDMKKIRELQQKVTGLEALLPGDGAEVGPGDTHIKLAKAFLMNDHKVPESRAQELAMRLNIMETSMEKGMRVHFYYDPAKDFFGTWVSQGSAKRTPLALIRAKEMRLVQERDTAVAKATDLEQKKAEMEEVLAKLKIDIEALEARKASLESTVSQLASEKNVAVEKAEMTGAELARQKNLLFYEADLAERLRARGVLKSSSKALNMGSVKFASQVDLRTEKSFSLKPSQFGVDKITDIWILPDYIKEGRDLGVQFVEDGTIQVTVLNEDVVRGQKVLFVLEKD